MKRYFVYMPILVLASFFVIWVGSASLRKQMSNRETKTTPQVTKVADAPVYQPIYGGPVTINLPFGQKFVAFVPAEVAFKIPSAANRHAYITTERLENEQPRRLMFIQPSYSPGSMEPILYIQEH